MTIATTAILPITIPAILAPVKPPDGGGGGGVTDNKNINMGFILFSITKKLFYYSTISYQKEKLFTNETSSSSFNDGS